MNGERVLDLLGLAAVTCVLGPLTLLGCLVAHAWRARAPSSATEPRTPTSTPTQHTGVDRLRDATKIELLHALAELELAQHQQLAAVFRGDAAQARRAHKRAYARFQSALETADRLGIEFAVDEHGRLEIATR